MSRPKHPQDLVAIFHSSFHPTKGNIIDWSSKASQDLKLANLEFNTLPSGLHVVESDIVYFTTPNPVAGNSRQYTGVSVFRRRPTTSAGHRGFLLSALGILLAPSAHPRPWRHVNALKELYARPIFDPPPDGEPDLLEPRDNERQKAAESWFEERQLRRADLGGEDAWSGWADELLGDEEECPLLHLSHMLALFGPSSMTLYKHIVGRKRVLIYTRPPQRVESACALAFVASALGDLDPALSSTQGRLPPSMSPLPVLGLVTLNDTDRLVEAADGWVACTTDAIFLDKPRYYDLMVDLTDPGMSIGMGAARPSFWISQCVELDGGKKEWRRSAFRFAWSDVKLWNEIDRMLVVCTPTASGAGGSGGVLAAAAACCGRDAKPRSLSAAWTDVWRVYEEVCVVCAGLWMSRASGRPTSDAATANRSTRPPSRLVPGGLIDLDQEGDIEEDDAGATSTMRLLGLGIEGRPNAGGASTTPQAVSRNSGKGWKIRKDKSRNHPDMNPPLPTPTTPFSGSDSFKQADDDLLSPRVVEQQDADDEHPDERHHGIGRREREREAMATLALLQTFHAHTTWQVARLLEILSSPAGDSSQDRAQLTPRDVLGLELGPFSVMDSRYLGWLADKYAGGRKIMIKRGWREVLALVFGV